MIESKAGFIFYQKQDDASSRVPLNVPSYTYLRDSKQTKKFTAIFPKQVKEKLNDVAQRYSYPQNRVVIDSIALLMEHKSRKDEGYSLYMMKSGDNSSITKIKVIFPF